MYIQSNRKKVGKEAVSISNIERILYFIRSRNVTILCLLVTNLLNLKTKFISLIAILILLRDFNDF